MANGAKPLSEAGLTAISRPPNLRREVYDTLRAAIVEGRAAPGSELGSVELARQLGVSRTPVREALQRLVQEGLAVTGESGVVRVRSLDLDDVAEFFDVRAELEGFAAERAASRVSAAELEQIRAAHEAVIADRRRPDAIEHGVVLNRDFHREIRHASGNRLLVRALAQLEAAFPTGMLANVYEHASYEQSIEQHAAILEALERHDPELARAQTSRHVLWTKEFVLRALRSEREGADGR